jgi:hypothetical protein
MDLRPLPLSITCNCALLLLLAPHTDGSSRASLELPCLTEAIVATMLGPELMRKATNGKKQVQVGYE